MAQIDSKKIVLTCNVGAPPHTKISTVSKVPFVNILQGVIKISNFTIAPIFIPYQTERKLEQGNKIECILQIFIFISPLLPLCFHFVNT